jgi:hypothetical protein
MTAAKYPRRAIALGPPFDDGRYWTVDGQEHRLPEPASEPPRETGPEFVARTTRENAEAVAPIRARMETLDSKGHRIGYRALNGGRRFRKRSRP